MSAPTEAEDEQDEAAQCPHLFTVPMGPRFTLCLDCGATWPQMGASAPFRSLKGEFDPSC